MNRRGLAGLPILILIGTGLFLGFTGPVDASEATHPFTAEDLVMMKSIGGTASSPDGQWIVFPLTITDLEENKRLTNLWIVRPDGSGLRQITSQPGDDRDPCWSVDGRTLYYLSTRSGTPQVWKIDPEAGEPVQVTDTPLDIANLKISPDGKSLAFTMEVFPGTSIEETALRRSELDGANTSGVVYTKLPVRHWDTWSTGLRNHIFVMPLATKKPVDIMNVMDADSPSKPFGGSEEFTFTPDGSGVVFAAADNGGEEAWLTDWNLYLAPADGAGSPVNITPDNPARDTTPVFSADGTTLAYLATTCPGYESDRYEIRLMSWPDREDTVLAGNWDRSPTSIVWSQDAKTIYATAPDLGQHSLFAIDTATGEIRTLVGQGYVSSVEAAGDRIVYSHANLTAPADLHALDPAENRTWRITGVNRDRLSTVRMGEYEQFSFSGWNNETVYGYIVKPVNFDASREYPVALLIHGGPQDWLGNGFGSRWNPQPYAGRGYAVVMIDFHGSIGYGRAFTDSIRNDWGGKPFTDLELGLDAVLTEYPWMDEGNVSALGASYGGYMVNWIAGNWPGRFRCLVCHDGIFDTRSMYHSTDELWFPEWDFSGTPWSNQEGYSINNPAEHADNWTTPMLVIQGRMDYRVPETEGLAAFTVLQRKGIPSEFLYFPDENHWVQKPENKVFWYSTILGWLDRWTENVAT
ncbi:MAG TPA: S9 family peptidase [Methanoculleus sp.]|nr:S9 family peptidase [Methanoculleus sp.]